MKTSFKDLYKADLDRYGGGKVQPYIRIWLFLYRMAQTRKTPLTRVIYKSLFRVHSRRRGIEIPTCCRIGKGLYVGHFFNVTVNGSADLGDNCNLHKGVTVGSEARGPRMGVPTIGNCVNIGVNAVVLGKITVGDDVLIAANSFVNCDIPSHSVVFDNPCIIKPREHATESYINHLA